MCGCERTAECAREMIHHLQQMAQPPWCRFERESETPRSNRPVGRPIPYNRRWLANQQREL
jgi:hypothetical protein